MRKVYRGKFSDYKPASIDYDNGLIGGNIAARYDMEKAAKTIGLEYYIKDENGRNVMIKDATILEKLLARLKYAFNSNKGKVIGYRSDKMSDVLRYDYSLGCKLDEGRKKWVVDKAECKSRGNDDVKKNNPKIGEIISSSKDLEK